MSEIIVTVRQKAFFRKSSSQIAILYPLYLLSLRDKDVLWRIYARASSTINSTYISRLAWVRSHYIRAFARSEIVTARYPAPYCHLTPKSTLSNSQSFPSDIPVQSPDRRLTRAYGVYTCRAPLQKYIHIYTRKYALYIFTGQITERKPYRIIFCSKINDLYKRLSITFFNVSILLNNN